MNFIKKVGGISVDGTKIKASASKHAAVSYKRAGEMITQLELEIEQLITKAEDADSRPLDDGLSVPDEIARREARLARLKEARKIIEQRYEDERREKKAEYDRKVQAQAEKRQAGKTVRGRSPAPPPDEPPANKQYNFTDPDSHIMKSGSGQHFEQAYNCQTAVDAEGSMLILGEQVTNQPNDKKQLAPTLDQVDPEVREPDYVLADNGYFSESEIEKIETGDGPTVYAATGKRRHGKSVTNLEKRDDPSSPAEDASITEKMKYRLATREGRERYKLRKQTVEPPFGIIKEAMGFRQFHLRGHPKVSREWSLVCLAFNFRRLFKLTGGSLMLENGTISPCCA
jgi:hypothetical protein